MTNPTHTADYWIKLALTCALDAVANLDDFRDRLGTAAPLDRSRNVAAQQAASAEAFKTMMADGRLRRLTRREQMERAAAGHPDNESTQAARRVLAKMDARKAINCMSRTDLQQLLEAYGFAVYDSEDTDDLREAVRVNLADGTINPIACFPRETGR